MTITLITGGARSGKSRYALDEAARYENKIFVATAEALDDEMQQRIDRHKAERDPTFETREAPYDLADALTHCPADTEVILVDCLTVWLGNLLHRHGPDADAYPEIDAFFARLSDPPCDLICVSNEVGLGIVPGDPLSRRFRDEAGTINQRLARLADRVIFVVSGQPLVVKGS